MAQSAHLDRLSALVSRFEIRAAPADVASEEPCNLAILGDEDGAPVAAAFHPLAPLTVTLEEGGPRALGHRVLAGAWANCGGVSNPIARALPQPMTVSLSEHPETAALVEFLVFEASKPRCGGAAAIGRLCEVLIILLLRRAMERGATRPGLLSGLAHPQLRRTIVAIHDAPERAWSTAELAEVAGMSRTQFMAAFRETMDETPIRYLTSWRMLAAEAELARGARVGAVARRCGYASAEAFSRAFLRATGRSPGEVLRGDVFRGEGARAERPSGEVATA